MNCGVSSTDSPPGAERLAQWQLPVQTAGSQEYPGGPNPANFYGFTMCKYEMHCVDELKYSGRQGWRRNSASKIRDLTKTKSGCRQQKDG